MCTSFIEKEEVPTVFESRQQQTFMCLCLQVHWLLLSCMKIDVAALNFWLFYCNVMIWWQCWAKKLSDFAPNRCVLNSGQFSCYVLIIVWLLALFWPYNRIDTKQIANLIACLALNEYFRHISIPWAITRKKYETFKCCVSTIKCNTFVTHITSTALSY